MNFLAWRSRSFFFFVAQEYKSFKWLWAYNRFRAAGKGIYRFGLPLHSSTHWGSTRFKCKSHLSRGKYKIPANEKKASLGPPSIMHCVRFRIKSAQTSATFSCLPTWLHWEWHQLVWSWSLLDSTVLLLFKGTVSPFWTSLEHSQQHTLRGKHFKMCHSVTSFAW